MRVYRLALSSPLTVDIPVVRSKGAEFALDEDFEPFLLYLFLSSLHLFPLA